MKQLVVYCPPQFAHIVPSLTLAFFSRSKKVQNYQSDDFDQSIDEHMTKFQGHSSMKQYLQLKPIKWGFKWWFRCASSTGYLYEFDLYLVKKNIEVNLAED